MSSNLDLGGQARGLIDDVEILGRTPSVTVRVGAVWALSYWRVARRDCHPDPVIALGPTWVTATGWDTVEDWVEAQLSSRWGAQQRAQISIKEVYAPRCAR